ncbi:transglycosylase SLT domain-containing protein [Streptomyces hoynatensis]|uniref:Lytic transglycosylase n=1 Tax=Streptomyces hoynatensis TaxID=1141874 RepID=A0A3A9Z9A6_9ACTN|nr:transglycosylase SLT domain-containing protein [Streptomyces hoynatensis]RKN44875.1 lytic transglycosylase [Streptomyces hoynatensis]
MTATNAPGTRQSKARKLSIAGVLTAGAAAVAVSLVPGQASAATSPQATTAPAPVASHTASSVAFSTEAGTGQTQTVRDGIGGSQTSLRDAPAQTTDSEPSTTRAQSSRPAEQPAQQESEAPKPAQTTAPEASDPKPEYPDNLDGWIREALAIMKQHDIPGSYEGIHRNIMRESSGNPRAINLWDINAKNGVPSKGLLQVIQPTFNRYHVEGTSWDLYDPVANIVAACNYAADRYGSMDNVNSAY